MNDDRRRLNPDARPKQAPPRTRKPAREEPGPGDAPVDAPGKEETLAIAHENDHLLPKRDTPRG